jgi:hypothetical protein
MMLERGSVLRIQPETTLDCNQLPAWRGPCNPTRRWARSWSSGVVNDIDDGDEVEIGQLSWIVHVGVA